MSAKAPSEEHNLSRWDAAGIVGGMLLMVAVTCVIMRGRILWEDETLGWMLLHDSSFRHMVSAWQQGADGGGFTFYLTGRAWLQAFGASDLSFRLYSTTCVALAYAVTWIAARRFYRIGIVAFAVINTFFFSRSMLLHMREGRFYGLLALGVALAFALVLRLARMPRPTPARWYLAMFLVHGLLTTSHLLGVVYSGFLLGALAVLDVLERRPRPLLYLAGAASWLLLLPERSNLVASAAVGKPHFWIKAPHFGEILDVYNGLSREIALVLVAVLALAAWTLWRGRRGLLHEAWTERKPVYVAGAALLLVPGAFLLEGAAGGTWLFHSRYLLPVMIAIVYATAEGLHLVRTGFAAELRRQWPVGVRLLGATGVALYTALLLFWGFHHVIDFTPSARDYTTPLTALLPQGVPVVCEDAFSFTELIQRQHSSGVRYMYLLDWEQAIRPDAPALEVTQYHLMENWRKVGYYADAIEPIGSFLNTHDRFLVLHTSLKPPSSVPPEIGNPLVERFRNNGGYEVRPFAQYDRKQMVDTAWMVCRGRCEAQTGKP